MIGLDPIYDVSSATILPWTRHWLNSRGLQNAQETRLSLMSLVGLNKMSAMTHFRILNYEKMVQILWEVEKKENSNRKFETQMFTEPDELNIENAYKTRWIWYHTILGLLMLMANMIMLAIFLLLAIKL